MKTAAEYGRRLGFFRLNEMDRGLEGERLTPACLADSASLFGSYRILFCKIAYAVNRPPHLPFRSFHRVEIKHQHNRTILVLRRIGVHVAISRFCNDDTTIKLSAQFLVILSV